MIAIDPAELAAWTAANRRARDEYALNPNTDGYVYGPCLTYGCDQGSRFYDGHCTDHRPQGDR